VVERLHARLAARARAALADRMIGIALNFLCLYRFHPFLLAVDRANRLPLHHAHVEAASRAALLTHRPNPAFFAGHERVLADEQRNQLLRLAAAVENEAGRADHPACFEKLASFHN
jgi:hypothetical protein